MQKYVDTTQEKNRKVKRYEDLTFTDDFMFCKILQNNPELCKELTELILGKKIGEIVQTERQKSIEITADGKGVRFDVYFEDDKKTIYDIEMQASWFKALPKRSRYYQGMIDLNKLERGEKYENLKPCYIVFICLANPFPEIGLHKYTFKNTCTEMPKLALDDGAVKVFLSAEGTKDDVSEEMKGFLTFLTSRKSSTDLTRRLAEEVEKARHHERWKVEYMTLLERDEHMREEGRIESRISLVIKKLIKGYTVAVIADQLEESEETIQDIIRIAEKYAPEYPSERNGLFGSA